MTRLVNIESAAEDPAALDALLVQYVSFCHKTDIPHYVCKHSVLYVQWMFRHLHGLLPRTWDAIKSWHLSRPWRPRTPFSEEVILFLFLRGLEHVVSEPASVEAAQEFLVGLLCWTAFAGLLRPGETLKLRWNDVRIVEQAGATVCIVAIRLPKTKAFMGRMQFSLIRDPRLCKWLEWAKGHCQNVDKTIWPQAQHQFRALLKNVLRREGLNKLRYTLGSCRPGGATTRFIAGESVERLQFQGRWSSTSSLKSYIQESMAWLCWAALPPRIESHVRKSVSSFAHVLSSPPIRGPR